MKDNKQQKNGSLDGRLRKVLWSVEEDKMLLEYVNTHGKGHWNRVSKQAGLKRSGKSCRLRWMNYLSPSVKRERFTEDEDDLIIRLHNLLGNRWALIAGRVPGRTDNQVKNYWNTHLSKKLVSKNITGNLNSGCMDHNHQSTVAAEDQVISSEFSSNTTCRTTKSLSVVPIERASEEEEDASAVLKSTQVGSRHASRPSETGQREMDHGSCFMQYLDDYTLHFVLNNNLRDTDNASPSPTDGGSNICSFRKQC